MKLYFVRHGETDWNERKRLQGWCNTSLNTRGAEQAKKLRERILKEDLVFDVCYSSPLKRVLRTAEIITGGEVPIIQDSLLKERGFGEMEGQLLEKWSDLGVDIFDEELNAKVYGIEPILTLQKRAKEFLDRVRRENNEEAQILIVSSGGIIKRMLYLATEDEYYKSSSFHVDNCKLITVDY